ncbi:hypothetical protein GGI07_004654 [Coemansia sp. Benny D115]|nr:hypothetical protein GGI07_004654 [Coemansia sp. Benny D115]
MNNRQLAISDIFAGYGDHALSTDGVLISNNKYFNDPIHGYISLSDKALQIIDTPQFQRLRHLKQMGVAYHVFPGASHNRFEHCVGVSYLANKMAQGLRQRQPELDINDRDIRCVTLAGLCHDLGHGPFSHVFDRGFIPRVCPGSNWTHEQASEMMLDHAIDKNNIDIDTSDVNFIKQLIRGSDQPVAGEKMFLFDIVANKRNGLDVDKYDYIGRDCFNIGVKCGYDYSRLMLNSRVIGNEICYDRKVAYDISELYHSRYSLFKRVYGHHANKCIALMVVDALVIADPVLKISDAIFNPDLYLDLTDEVVRDIVRSHEPELQPARDIIRRLQTRDLYRFVDEYVLPAELDSLVTSKSINEATIVGFRGDGDDFVEHDVLISFVRYNHGMKKDNPMDHVGFYSKYSADEKVAMPSDFVSMCGPQRYEERILRIFTRTPSKCKQIREACRRLMAKINPRFKDE